jgi:hypothetical protein
MPIILGLASLLLQKTSFPFIASSPDVDELRDRHV